MGPRTSQESRIICPSAADRRDVGAGVERAPVADAIAAPTPRFPVRTVKRRDLRCSHGVEVVPARVVTTTMIDVMGIERSGAMRRACWRQYDDGYPAPSNILGPRWLPRRLFKPSLRAALSIRSVLSFAPFSIRR
jgi:hypothetical protein